MWISIVLMPIKQKTSIILKNVFDTPCQGWMKLTVRAVGMTEAGVCHTDVARQFGVHRNTVDALWRRYEQFGTTRDRSRSGRPLVTPNHQDTCIRVVHLRDRLRSATLTASISGLRRISPRTVRNRFAWTRHKATTSSHTSVLQQHHRLAHYAWCRRHIHFTQQDWARVLFTD